MTLHLYNNMSLYLEAAPLIRFFKQENGHYRLALMGTDAAGPLVHAGKIEVLKTAIEDYNAAGGRYYWLFSNVAINLDLVSMVWRNGNRIVVESAGGSWTSSEHDKAADHYRLYLEHLELEQRSDAAPPKAGGAALPAGKAMGTVDEAALARALEKIDTMIGLGSAKRDIRENIALAQLDMAKAEIGMPVAPVSRHMVFTGNPGTGKTTFAREVARIYHALGFLAEDKLVETSRADLVAEYQGQTAPKIQRKLEEARGGVLFIDEAYALMQDQSGARDSYGHEAVAELLKGMEDMRDELVVIVAGYPAPMRRFIASNEGLQSRFVTYIGFDDYNMDELGQIMDQMAAHRGHVFAPDARAHVLALLDSEKTACEEQRALDDNGGSAFGNGRAVRNLVEQAVKALAFRLHSDGMLAAGHGQSAEERKAALSTITFADVRGLAIGKVTDISVSPAAPVGKRVSVRQPR